MIMTESQAAVRVHGGRPNAWRVCLVLTALIVTLTASGFAPGRARADTFKPLANPNLCIDVNQQTLKVTTWMCNGGPNQDFITTAYGQQRFVVNGQIVCLDSAGATQGSDVVMRVCNPSAASQRWGQTTAGASSALLVRNEAGWCLDVPQGVGVSGGRLEIWQCNGGANQQFFRSGASAPGAAVVAGGGCANADIARAIREVVSRAPLGSGSSGECDPAQYHGFSSYHDLVSKVTVRLTTKGVAYVFSAPRLAVMQGHVGWAYLGDDLAYHLGATDAPITKFNLFQGNLGLIIPASPGANSPWRRNASTEQELFDAFRQHGGVTDSYSEYKTTFVALRNSNLADQRANEAQNWGYGLSGNNCADHVYRVLQAYGVDTSGVMRTLATRAAPNSWFRSFGTMDIAGHVSPVTDRAGAAL